jgi:hypothetical protein
LSTQNNALADSKQHAPQVPVMMYDVQNSIWRMYEKPRDANC